MTVYHQDNLYFTIVVPIRHDATPTILPQLNFSSDMSQLKKNVNRDDVVLITVLLLTLKVTSRK